MSNLPGGLKQFEGLYYDSMKYSLGLGGLYAPKRYFVPNGSCWNPATTCARVFCNKSAFQSDAPSACLISKSPHCLHPLREAANAKCQIPSSEDFK